LTDGSSTSYKFFINNNNNNTNNNINNNEPNIFNNQSNSNNNISSVGGGGHQSMLNETGVGVRAKVLVKKSATHNYDNGHYKADK
jgi:hypothetical protein